MIGITDTIQRFDGLRSLGAVCASDIEKAEKELAVSFSPEYKEYTAAFGAVSFGGREFTGVVKPVSLDVVVVTKAARSITPDAKPDWYIVMDPHFDGIMIWQSGEGCIYQTEPGKEPRKIAESLEAYMKKGQEG